MLALLSWTTGTGPGQDMLHVLARQFIVYLLSNMMLAAVVGVIYYRLLRPIVLRYLPLRPSPWAALWLVLAGALAALVPLGLTVAVGLATNAYSPLAPGYVTFTPYIGLAHAPAGWMVWLYFVVQSTCEELMFRGVGLALLATLLAWLARHLFAIEGATQIAPADRTPGRIWFASGLLANLVVSMAFGSVHQDNPHVTVFAVCNIALAGFALGQLFWLQRNLWGACAMHTVWNASLATFGLPVSGILARGPLLGNIRGSVDDLITGGEFGPEASAVTTIGLLLVCVWLVWLTWRRAQIAPAVDITAEKVDLTAAVAPGEVQV